MADYIYLLETRLSKPQRDALQGIRDTARAHSLTLFLVGGAVRDLISGGPVRDLDIAIQGNALSLLKDAESSGALITGKLDLAQAFFATFPGGVRMEVGSTLSVTYPRPGKPEVQTATILDDLRRRDFTANSMALSLNEGSFGLLMDPLNGVADIENRELRLVSNYGFIEDPVRMIRAARLMARLGWRMDEKTEVRYQTGKEENYIAALDNFHRGYETEEVFYEEDPLRVMRRLEEEGWLKHLAPALSVSKANLAEIEKLREIQLQLQTQGVHTDGAAAYFPLLTAKLSESELAALKKSFIRSGFVSAIENLDGAAKRFIAELTSKNAALPSQAYKMIVASEPETVLWAAYTSKNGGFQAKLKNFYTEWPAARQKIPYTLMQEMRITPDLAKYAELIEQIFFEIMDGRLQSPEEIKAFLEPFSPPAPPPPVHLRRQRAAKKGAKAAKGRRKSATEGIDAEDDPDLDAIASDDADSDSEELTPDPLPNALSGAPNPGFILGSPDDDEDDDQDDDFTGIDEDPVLPPPVLSALPSEPAVTVPGAPEQAPADPRLPSPATGSNEGTEAFTRPVAASSGAETSIKKSTARGKGNGKAEAAPAGRSKLSSTVPHASVKSEQSSAKLPDRPQPSARSTSARQRQAAANTAVPPKAAPSKSASATKKTSAPAVPPKPAKPTPKSPATARPQPTSKATLVPKAPAKVPAKQGGASPGKAAQQTLASQKAAAVRSPSAAARTKGKPVPTSNPASSSKAAAAKQASPAKAAPATSKAAAKASQARSKKR